MEILIHELRHSLRRVVKHPSVTFYVVITLALGLSGSAVMLSSIDSYVLKAVPFDDPERLVQVWETHFANGIDKLEVAPANFLDFREQARVFEDLVGYGHTHLNLGGEGGEPERLDGARVSPGFFAALGVQPVQGREFRAQEEQEGAPLVVMLSHSLWQRRFNADASLVGKTLPIDGMERTVVGVLPADFQFLHLGKAQLWIPLAFSAESARNRSSHFIYAVARLTNGPSLRRAQTEIKALANRLAREHPDTSEGLSARLVPLKQEATVNYRLTMLALLGTVVFLLLIACFNLSSFQLARALDREKELAVQTALGASRGTLVRQLFIDSLVMGVLGVLLGLLFARWGLELLAASIPGEIRPYLPQYGRLEMGWSTLGFSSLLMLATTLIFGLWPAWKASSRPELTAALKDAGPAFTGAGVGRARSQSLLVIFQVALTAMLLVGAGLMVRSFVRLQQVDPGFQTSRLLTTELVLPGGIYDRRSKVVDFQNLLLEKLHAIPGVVSAAAIDHLPFDGSDASTSFSVPDLPDQPANKSYGARYRIVDSGFFETMGIPLVAGRAFSPRDDDDHPRVVIINQRLASTLWPAGDAVGRRLTLDRSSDVIREIVGVVGDVKYQALGEPFQGQIYLPFAQLPRRAFTLALRTAGEPLALSELTRQAVQSIDPHLPTSTFRTMESRVSDSLLVQRLSSRMLFIFALIALILAATGVYGLMAYRVSRSKHEMGIRMALGARHQDVLLTVVKRGVTLALIGAGCGVLLGVVAASFLSSLLFEVSAVDPLVLLGVLAGLVLVASFASYLPARQATQVQPTTILRSE